MIALVTFEQKLSSLTEEDDDHEKVNSVEQSQEEVASLKKISSTDTVTLYYEYSLT